MTEQEVDMQQKIQDKVKDLFNEYLQLNGHRKTPESIVELEIEVNFKIDCYYL